MIDRDALQKPTEPVEPTVAQTMASPRLADLRALRADLEAAQAQSRADTAHLVAELSRLTGPRDAA